MYKTLTIIHTALKTDIPKYMSDSIKLKLKNNLRSSNKKLLKQDINNNFPQLWNKLPITVTNENNTNTFKSKLHKYLHDLDWYNLTHPYKFLIIKMTYTLLLSNTIYITQLQIRHYLFLLPILRYHFYYLLLTNLTTTLYLPYMYIYKCHIFSTHYPLYIFPIYTMCIGYLPHMQFPLTASLHILPQLLPRLFIYFEKRIIYYINFVIFR